MVGKTMSMKSSLNNERGPNDKEEDRANNIRHLSARKCSNVVQTTKPVLLTFAGLPWGEPVLARLAVPDDPLDLVNRKLLQNHHRFGSLLKVLHQTQPLQFHLGLAPHVPFCWHTAILITFHLKEGWQRWGEDIDVIFWHCPHFKVLNFQRYELWLQARK